VSVETRFATIERYFHARRGRSSPQLHVALRCPYCDVLTDAMLWSLTGTGRRFECGVVYKTSYRNTGCHDALIVVAVKTHT
jgi:hypothetical protein